MSRGLALLYSDDALLVVDKPAGVSSVHDGARPSESNVTEMLQARHGALWPVHRLDRDTSGVLLLARTAAAHAILSAAFEARAVSKTYHALVLGGARWDERVIDAPLRSDGDRRHRTVVDAESGKPSVTRLRVLSRFGAFALVEARPETGRAHQIRVHLSMAGAPIACDTLYGDGQPILLSAHKRGYRLRDGDERPLLGRLGLHALRLELTHPLSGATITFEAPYARDFAAAVKQLGRL